MPCVVTKEEMAYYAAAENFKNFGKRASTSAILEEVACDMGRLLERGGLSVLASPLTRRWIEHHRSKDAAAGRSW